MTPYKVKKLPKLKLKNLPFNKVKIDNKINPREISVVVQGAVNADDTKKCLDSIRHYLPGSQIILSTWEGSDVSGLDYDDVLLNEDPGSINMGAGFRPNNINREIVSSRNGIKKANRKYLLKIRTDACLSGTGFANIYEYANNALNSRFPDLIFFKQKVIIDSHFTRDPNAKSIKLQFQPSDLWYFGLKEDIEDLFDIPLQYPEDATVVIDDKIHRKYTAEQYIWISFLNKKGYNISLEVYNEGSKGLTKNTIRTIVNNFFVLDHNKCGIKFPKKFKFHPADNLKYVMTTFAFLCYYKQFLNQYYIIPARFYPDIATLANINKNMHKLKEGIHILCSILKIPVYAIRILLKYIEKLPKIIDWILYHY